MKQRVLFLCIGNSCRSQMAEGWLRYLGGSRFEAFSAGLETHGVNPRAVRVMADVGVDISTHTSNAVDEFLGESFDLLVTVCGGRSWSIPGPRDTGPSLGGGAGAAQEACPLFIGEVKERQHWPFDDPAVATGAEEEILAVFRRVRDEIRHRVDGLLAEQS